MIAVFPDNTVFCNFAAVNRVDLLRDFLRGRGRWTAAVAHEVEGSTRYLPGLSAVDESWLGEPIDFTSKNDARRIERLRIVVFGGSQTDPLKHLGEAQTCFLFETHSELHGSWWISDDTDAREQAERRGARSMTTVGLAREMVADYTLTAVAALELLRAMADAGRPVWPPSSAADLQ
ncbi:MAG: hypothetical protein ACK5MT_01425 [Actinomycetales bacterium]